MIDWGVFQIHIGDCRVSMRQLAAKGVRAQCCITSPPYFGLRDYGRPGQIGLEKAPEEYVCALVEVFECVRELLADDGVLWLNLGDSYAGGGQNSGSTAADLTAKQRSNAGCRYERLAVPAGLKPKDLIGIPWRVALALQAAGWYLRQDIIWHKPNPMPESVTDRCTKAHEYLFLLTKTSRYVWNRGAMQEPCVGVNTHDVTGGVDRAPGQTPQGTRRSGNKARKPASARGVPVDTGDRPSGAVAGSVPWEGFTRNKRSVWTVPTRPYRGAHFATFPRRLIEPCVLATSRPGDLVLDPFAGSGTVGESAVCNGRRAILCDLNDEYVNLMLHRIVQAALGGGLIA